MKSESEILSLKIVQKAIILNAKKTIKIISQNANFNPTGLKNNILKPHKLMKKKTKCISTNDKIKDMNIHKSSSK